MLKISGKIIVSYCLLITLVPHYLHAREGVDVSFAVRAIQIQDIIKSQMSAKTKWNLSAVDLKTGKQLVDAKESRRSPFLPGSLVKLFVTAAILDKNADNPIDFDTIIAIQGKVKKGKLAGNVIVKGGGNPFLSSKDLLAGIEKVKSLGIKEITGNVIVDNSLISLKGWQNRYKGAAYGVPSALGLDLHTVSVAIDGTKRRVVLDPPNDAVTIRYKSSEGTKIRQINDHLYEMTRAASHVPTMRSRFSLRAPTLYAGGTFLTLLRQEGITVSGKVKKGIMPEQAREIARIGAPDINRFIRDTNMQSLNVAAENMLFLLGAAVYGNPGTRQKGVRAVKGFLERLGVPLTGMRMVDGSGVSEDNRVSAEQMATFLQMISKKPWFSDFYESLARPGIDGGLRDFPYKSENIRAKAGQLPQAYSLAGYVNRRDGRKIAFSYMVKGSGLDILRASFTAAEVLKHLEEK